jgi:hypothetical protein
MILGRRRSNVALRFLVCFLALLNVQFIALALRPDTLPRLTRRDYNRIDAIKHVTEAIDAKPIVDFNDPKSLLSRILIPRIPGTPENAKVRAALLEPFQGKNSRWNIEEHKFVASTPEGEKQMTNLIITYNVNAPRKLVLAAHHDSKILPKGFVGATDSAVPCAIIVDTALTFAKMMEERATDVDIEATWHDRARQTGLQLILFDGEEAYVQWTQSDSVYGSRALATAWSKTFFSPEIVKRRNGPGFATMRTIDSIDQFVLLDLLGTPFPRIPSYYATTNWMHEELRNIESRLAQQGLLYPRNPAGQPLLPPAGGGGTTKLPSVPGSTSAGTWSFFANNGVMMGGGIDDDHRPFLQKGVPILHLIPTPFPSVWHTMKDDASSLDWPTIYAWTMIMRVFVAEYFDLGSHLQARDNSTTFADRTLDERQFSNKQSKIELVSGHEAASSAPSHTSAY